MELIRGVVDCETYGIPKAEEHGEILRDIQAPPDIVVEVVIQPRQLGQGTILTVLLAFPVWVGIQDPVRDTRHRSGSYLPMK